MSDTTVPAVRPPHMNNTLSVVLAMLVLAFHSSIIVGCLLSGDPANSLHTSAMSWAFATDILILAGFGIGSDRILDFINAFTKR